MGVNAPAVGQCERCAHAHRVTSSRGSVFWRCRVHDEDPRWPKYPPLPVVGCPRFTEATPRDTDA